MWTPLDRCLLLAAVITASCGCARQDGPPRFAVRGAVQLDGQPLQAGRICFRPVEGIQGPAAVGVIADGFYEIPRHAGPVAGRHHVEIEADLSLPFALDDEQAYAAAMVQFPQNPLPRQPVPPHYNRRTILQVDVSDVPEANKFDFDLGTAASWPHGQR